MAKLSKDLDGTTLHPRELLFASGTLGVAGAEIVIPADGCATVNLDLRGTFSLTLEVAGTVDGVNWTLIPIRSLGGASAGYVTGLTGSLTGVWVGTIYGFRFVRVRCTSWFSGAATTTLSATIAAPDQSLGGVVNIGAVTATGVSGAATTLTLTAPGAGLRHYITYITINRFAAAVLTAAPTPVSITTTNLPGGLAFSFEADAAALGTMIRWREDFAYPLAATAQNTATTIVCPTVTGVIWRVTAGFYVGP